MTDVRSANGRALTRLAWHAFLFPRNVFVGFIIGWRTIISPLYGNVCRFHPTCSAFGLTAVRQFGVIHGSALTAWRIVRCNPFARGGIDEVPDRMDGNFPISRFGFVVPKQKDTNA